MSISVYCGLQGSGKSYEAIQTILKAIRDGRRVVTNISGIDSDKIRDFLVTHGNSLDDLGHVIVVPNERILEPDFFCGEPPVVFKFEVHDWIPLKALQFYSLQYPLFMGKNFTRTAYQLLLPELKKLKDREIDLASCLVMAAHNEWKTFQADSFLDKPRNETFADVPTSGDPVVQGGDLVVVDEAWRYWAKDKKITQEHDNFFRMHRHYLDQKGISCDLLILIQDFTRLHESLRGVIELVLIFTKLKSLGMSSKYRVDVYDGQPKKSSFVSSSPLQSYDKNIFPLYKSYDGPGGNEAQIDDRQNLFKNKIFSSVMILAVIGALFLVPSAYHLINSMIHPEKKNTTNTKDDSTLKPQNTAANSFTNPIYQTKTPPDSTQIRLVGVVESNRGQSIVFLQLEDGRIVRRNMSSGLIDGWQSITFLDGKSVTFSYQSEIKK